MGLFEDIRINDPWLIGGVALVSIYLVDRLLDSAEDLGGEVSDLATAPFTWIADEVDEAQGYLSGVLDDWTYSPSEIAGDVKGLLGGLKFW